MEKISKLNYCAITGLLLLVLVFNFLYWSNPLIALGGGLVYLAFYGFVLGSLYVAKRGWQFIFGPLLLLTLVAMLGAAALFLKSYTDWSFIFIFILIPLLLYPPYYKTRPEQKLTLRAVLLEHLDRLFERKEGWLNLVLVFAYLTLAAESASLLLAGQTSESTQSPWQTVPSLFFPLYFLATITLLTYLLRARRTKLPLALLVLHTLLATTVAATVYVVGYGYDPFVHQATERIINQTGRILPTPPYYLGQYAIVVFLHKLTSLDLGLIDRWLVPLLAAFFLPLTTFYTFSHWLKKRAALVLSLAILVVPFGSFIMTAPQNLANLIFMVTILLSMLYFRGQLHVTALYLLALAALAIHPLAGIPLLSTVFLLHLFKTMYESYRRSLSLFFLVAIMFSFALPSALMLNGSAVSLQTPAISWSTLSPLTLVNHFDPLLDLTYLIHWNALIVVAAVVFIGLRYLARHKLLVNNAPYLIIALVIFLNYVFVRYLVGLPNLEDLDQTAFVGRISLLGFYVLLPIFLIGLHRIITRLRESDAFGRVALVGGLSGLVMISLYLSYPRVNQYEPAKFFSVSASDLKAVELIEQTAAPDHVVLANQMVGAAAIQQFSFKKYYQGEFYYSMPMGSPRRLHELFLEMTYEGATRETMDTAMAYAGVDEAYFVLNRYWRDFENISRQATDSADKVFSVDDGAVMVFLYRLQ
ncbi:MAG: hypothetical protein A3J59_02765 [Candidatus Buchananbacteria bacterium RIFCSPHIGHO2_02_FULL_56_16]|uniref:Glycosyltransferase RgtA/B/C/D-like domain-containing protein n=1 Tax=Candidatus Buchananbacteria bacterium RIFCSPHIGHO2_02_FULL_56_16 TaxID=1797542 RepID=A0A1G1YG87_9BACT|nr:MAG: hypothetical protein A3J59_02765 [Candidatus Buchananbacteria bacterium RIFCSPHIGHO2_02_FULL_56_16]